MADDAVRPTVGGARELHVLSLGAGVQSTTLYLLALEGALHIDAAVFADTQEEPQAVYTHLGRLMSRGHHRVPIIVRTAGRLGDDLMRGRPGKSAAPMIPFFTRDHALLTDATGKAQRACTRDYKIRVIGRAIRQDLLGLKPRARMPRDVVVYQYIGISLDEARRARTIRARFGARERRGVPRFPLLEMEWTRGDCERFNAERISYPITRSACVFCPLKNDAEWVRLKTDDPAGWARAVEIDAALRGGAVSTRGLREAAYLSETAMPLTDVVFNPRPPSEQSYQREFPGFSRECEGGCGV